MNSEIAEEYVVQHGQGGYLGRFRNRSQRGFQRGDAVVVRTLRGLEIGTILNRASAHFASAIEPVPSGELLRGLTSEDAALNNQLAERTRILIEDAQQVAERSALSLTILDGEILLDGDCAILQVLRWGECDATALFADLSARHGLKVQLHDLTSVPQQRAGCGEENCGSGNCSSCGSGGGCSTGSCSSGAVKSAGELTAYFADLRSQMEADVRRVSLIR
jgi:hypothetical protein